MNVQTLTQAFTFVWNIVNSNETVPALTGAITGATSTRLRDKIISNLNFVLQLIYGHADAAWKTRLGVAFPTVVGQSYIPMPSDWSQQYEPHINTADGKYSIQILTDVEAFQNTVRQYRGSTGTPLFAFITYDPTVVVGSFTGWYVAKLAPTPSAVIPYLIDYRRGAPTLTTGTDSPMLPPEWMPIWLHGTVAWTLLGQDKETIAKFYFDMCPDFIKKTKPPPDATQDDVDAGSWMNLKLWYQTARPFGISGNL